MEFAKNFIKVKHPNTHGKSILMRFKYTLRGLMTVMTFAFASQFVAAQSTTLDIAMPPAQILAYKFSTSK
jgi:hypothetical protein